MRARVCFLLFSCEYYENSKNTFSYRTPPVAAFVNSKYANVFFTQCWPLKMLICHLWKCDFSNFKMTFAKDLIKKQHFLWQIWKALIKFYSLTKFYHVVIADSIMAAFQLFFTFYTKVHFLCLLLLSLKCFSATKILK